MPLRFLRPGLTTSLRWNSLDWFAQSFYVRLITLVDDFGRYDADLRLLKSHAFPLCSDVGYEQLLAACKQLQTSALAVFYADSERKPYLQLTKWQEKARSRSKFPEINACEQLLTLDNICLAPSPSPSPSPLSLLGGNEPPNEPPFPECEWPTEREFLDYCRETLGIPEWKARDEWLKQEAARPKWKNIGNWRAHAKRLQGWWEADGRPKTQKEKYDTDKRTHVQGVDRKRGTVMEGMQNPHLARTPAPGSLPGI